MKKLLFLLPLLLFVLIPKDAFALSSNDMEIILYSGNSNTTVISDCKNTDFCTNDSGDLITRVSIRYNSFNLIEGGKYNLYSTIQLWKDNTSTNINGDRFFTGNLLSTQWNNKSVITWNSIDRITWDPNTQLNVIEWGLVQQFTSIISSNGITFDFYFLSPTFIEAIRVKRFDIENYGNTTNDAINNSSNNIINNQNSNQAQTNEKLDNAENTRKGIWETIKNLPKAFLDMLLGLFIPDDFDFLDNFKDSLEDKLGFIAEVPLSVIDFLFDLATVSWEPYTTVSFPSIDILGFNFWNSQEIDLTPAIGIFSPFKYFTDILCVVLCVNTLRKWYESFASGGGAS